MALVPFSVSGAAASQDLEERLMQVGHYSLLLRQRPEASGNTAHLRADSHGRNSARPQQAPLPAAGPPSSTQQQQQQQQQPDLSNVGLVLWLSGYVLADFLLLRLAAAGGAAVASNSSSSNSSCDGLTAGSSGSWAGVRVLELGCGAGTVGMFLAKAGAQVVLTDQPHILGLTRENLQLNFQGSSCAQQAPVAQALLSPAAQPARCPAQQQPTSAAAAFAAAFAPSAVQGEQQQHAAAAAQQQQDDAHSAAQGLASRVFGAGQGPLVVEYSWREPAALLQDRVAAAAAARLQPGGPEEQAVFSASDVQRCLAADFDVIVGADLLYDAAHHGSLLHSLQLLTAANSLHTQVFLCWRSRGLGEEAFLVDAAAAGWFIEEVPAAFLHPEFQTGFYKLVRMVRLP